MQLIFLTITLTTTFLYTMQSDLPQPNITKNLSLPEKCRLFKARVEQHCNKHGIDINKMDQQALTDFSNPQLPNNKLLKHRIQALMARLNITNGPEYNESFAELRAQRKLILPELYRDNRK